ncbi:MAG: FAD-dependent oxidoreductase [Cyclobacteriaceae bacterium]
MTHSLWEVSAEKQNYPTLQKNSKTDVLIVGGGITGVSTAYRLQQAGLRVCLLEGYRLGNGVTGKTTAHLTTSVDAGYSQTASNISKEAATLLAQAAREAIDVVEENDRSENLQSRFRRVPAYQYAASEKQVSEVEKEMEAAREAGVFVSEVAHAPELPFQTLKGIKYANNAVFNPMIYIFHLAQRFVEKGGELYEHTLIEDFKEKDGQVLAQTSTGHSIRAKHMVMATHMPLDIDPTQTMAPPYRSYAMSFTTRDEVPEALYYDLDEPYHYIRPAQLDGKRTWVVGGADHKTGSGDEQAAAKNLKQYVAERFDVDEYLQTWSGQVFEPVDGLPFIGKSLLHKHIYIAGGYSGDGTLWGSFASKLLTDLITGKENPHAKLFSPARFNLKSGAGEFIKANAEVGWHFIADRFTSDTKNVEQIPRGEGRILNQGAEQYAVYRDEAGELHVMSSTCVHLKCKVNWNNLEKTWDCPCHGGRYKATGEVLEGPPHHSLKGKDL